MQFPHPPMPAFAPDRAAEFQSFLRYEDVAQDGRLMPLALPPAMSGLWQAAIVNTPGSRNSIAKGVIPILTRLTLATRDQPVRVDRPVSVRAGLDLAHARDAAGEVSRLFMNVWCEVSGVAGRIGPRAPDGALAPAGILFAEHTFTRPLAPPDQRRVTRLDAEGYPEVPPTRYDAPAPETAQEAPAGATWTTELAPDTSDFAFTLDQTDSNQHINSLIYIRIFLEAAQRRIASAGLPLKIKSRAVDIAYRKPCFAGDQVRAHTRLFELEGQPGAAGFIAGADGKPRCYVRVSYGT
jgi:hypothetical protein